MEHKKHLSTNIMRKLEPDILIYESVFLIKGRVQRKSENQHLFTPSSILLYVAKIIYLFIIICPY